MRHVSGDGANAQGGFVSSSPTVQATPTDGTDSGKKDKGKKDKGKKDKKDKKKSDSLPGGPAGTVMLSLSDDGTAVRGVRGTCEEHNDASVEISTDTGESFDDVTPGLTSVLHVEAVSDSEVWVVGTDSDCEPRRFETDDLGRTWDESSADGSWYLDADDASKVHGTKGKADPGCTPVSVIVVDSEVARAGCDDGTVRGTDDGGKEWVTLGSLPDDLGALTYDGPSNAYGLAPTDGCTGQVFESSDGGSEWDEAGCIDGDDLQAIAANEDAVIAQVDGKVFRSTDDGQTWEKA
ncbi:MAG: WD40/YVTN/BNR-like repeat-containing protein, partial [Nocardioidaceae bacterium]